jgi:hypothetical protein
LNGIVSKHNKRKTEAAYPKSRSICAAEMGIVKSILATFGRKKYFFVSNWRFQKDNYKKQVLARR